MVFLGTIVFIAFVLNFFLALFVYLKDPSKKINRLFGIFGFITAIWVFANFMTGIQQNLFWLKTTSAFGAFVPLSAVFWILELCDKKITKREIFLLSGLGLFFFIISYFNDFIVANVKRVYLGGFEGETGSLFVPYFIYIFGILSFILFILISEYLRAQGIRKLQISYVILGAILYISTVLIVSFISPFFGIYKFTLLDSPSSLFLLFFTALAITRYHLFEIKVILTELLVGIMGVVLVVLPFLMPTPNLKILTLAVFLLFLIFGYYLVNATHKEAKRREEAESMAVRERALRLRTERLTRARDQFILSSQHYFRTPLTSIIGFLEMVLDESYGKLPEKVKEKLGLTSRSVLELRKRIEESLDISQFQIRKGKGILSLEEVRVEDLIKNVIEELKPQAKEKNLYLEVSFPENPLPKMKLDKKRMFMVFVNLIDNGIKHTLKGGIKLFLEYLKDKNSILFSVKDTGIGIPREELPFIGQMPFERGRKAKELTPLGKGIGLYLSRLVVEAHGGKLWAESEGIGKGSVFYIELPVK